jgi:DNA-binding NarL/FixJ family response regulator
MPTQKTASCADILIVDDHPIVRFGFIALLRQIDEKWKFEEANGAADAIEAIKRGAPRIAIIDLSLAGVLSLELIKRMKALSPTTAILVVSMQDEKLYAARAFRAGARGYVMKQIAAAVISQAVQRVLEGKIWLSEDARADLIDRIAGDLDNAPGFHALSDRELAVFRLIGMGMRKGDIARELKISPNTVETYRTNIKLKMGVASGAELSRIAFLHVQEEAAPRVTAASDNT